MFAVSPPLKCLFGMISQPKRIVCEVNLHNPSYTADAQSMMSLSLTLIPHLLADKSENILTRACSIVGIHCAQSCLHFSYFDFFYTTL